MKAFHSICLQMFFTLMFLHTVFAQEPSGLVEHLWETQDEQKRRLEELRDTFSMVKDITAKVGDMDTTLSLESIRIKLDGEVESVSADMCGSDVCFDFYYFKGEHFDTQNSARKNILYISGGPGKVLTFDDRALRLLEDEYNVVYFHLRGSGLSAFPPSNKYDRFLRTKYAVEDIEKLRKKILTTTSGSTRPWDAMVGYSYGTVLAQQYANKYSGNVNRLILHAPIYRDNDTDKARSNQLRSQLRRIYTLVRSKESVACSCKPVKPENMKIKAAEEVSAADNFCYLDSDSNGLIDTVIGRIVTEYDKIIDEFGAIGFVTENYETFKKLYGPMYPDEFYFALRKLTLMGAPEDENSSLSRGSIEHMVDAALVLGYYASLDRAKLLKIRENNHEECSLGEVFFQNAPADTCQQTSYCDRLKAAMQAMARQETRPEPPRALYVFGVLDGLQHWLPRVLREDGIEVEEENCPTGENLIKFTSRSSEKYKLLRELGRKIGVTPVDDYCLWNPGRFQHSVQTIVIAGRADLVTAGCEAENFFDTGLVKGQRMIIEFPTMGHEASIPLEIVPKILAKSTLEEVRTAIQQDVINLGAANRTPEDGSQLQCRLTQ
jgi:pimeloyl-ACP methyl ester carboxylesterase